MIDFLTPHSLKLGIALALSILFAQTFHFQYPYFIAMSAIISLSTTSLSSVAALKNRTIGTILGALIGMMLTYLSKGNFLLSGLGMIFLATSLSHLNMPSAIGISGYVLAAVMLNTGSDVFTYTLDRTIDTLIGGIIAILVSILILPRYSYKKFLKRLDILWDFTFSIMYNLENNQLKLEQIEEIPTQIDDFQQDLNNFKQEPFSKFNHHLPTNYDTHLTLLKDLYIHLSAINQTSDNHILSFHRQESINLYNQYLKSYE
ncbi:MAG: FUSC family protein [Erysipelotrichaceae bacterium]